MFGALWLHSAATGPCADSSAALPVASGTTRKKQGLVSLCILFPFLGWGSYLALNARLFGDPFAFLEFQAAPPWYQSIKWIGSNLMQHWQMALKYPGLAPFIYHAQLVLYFAAMALLFIGFWSKAPTHWLIWGGAYLGMCYLAGWLISGGRYVFGCLPPVPYRQQPSPPGALGIAGHKSLLFLENGHLLYARAYTYIYYSLAVSLFFKAGKQYPLARFYPHQGYSVSDLTR